MLDTLVSNNLFLSIAAFGLVLIPAILIHEIGHFLAAKAVGITVLEFGIGFPPRMTRLFIWGETEFTLNWTPLGGFVRPLGEDLIRPLGDEAVERDRRKAQTRATGEKKKNEFLSEREELVARGITEMKSVNEVKPFPRIFFMIAGALANFAFAFVLFIIIALIGLPQDVGGRVQAIAVPQDSTLAAIGVEEGDLIELINGEMFANTEEFFATLASFENQEITLTIRKIETGEIVDLLFTPTSATTRTESLIRVSSVEPESPAELGGILVNDLITGINGIPITDSSDPIGEIQTATLANAGQEMTLNIRRSVDGELRTTEISVVPRTSVREDQGRIGIGIWDEFQSVSDIVYTDAPPHRELVPQPFGTAISYGFERIGSTLRLIAEIPARLINQTITVEEARPLSVVAISQIGAQFLQQSIEENEPILFLNYMAIISIALGFTNLLPIPAFDGGRILFVLIEIVRGRPVSPEREGLVHLVGMVVVLSLGLMVILYDLFNPYVLPQ